MFFDADGTICDIEKGKPASAVEAITKLVKNGHQAWLCTGRSRAFVPDYLEQIPFTGMISACGCTIEKDGKRLFNKEMTTEAAWHSVEVLRKYGMIPVMEGADWMYYDKDEYNTDINWYADLITKALGAKWRPVKGYEHDLHINKISSKIVPGSDPAYSRNANSLGKAFRDHLNGIPGKTFPYMANKLIIVLKLRTGLLRITSRHDLGTDLINMKVVFIPLNRTPLPPKSLCDQISIPVNICIILILIVVRSVILKRGHRPVL